MRLRSKRGQAFLEIILVLAVVIGALVAALLSDGGIGEKVECTYIRSGNMLTDNLDKLGDGIFE